MSDLGTVLLGCISFVCAKYNLSVDRVSDDPDGVVIWLSSRDVRLVVSYDIRSAEFYIELRYVGGAKEQKVSLDRILSKSGVRYPVHWPRMRGEIEAGMTELARLLDIYAGDGLRGDPHFFERFSAG